MTNKVLSTAGKAILALAILAAPFAKSHAGVSETYTLQKDGIEYAIDTENNTASVQKATSDVPETVKIPGEILYNGKTYLVTEIGSSAFEGCSAIAEVDIPTTVTLIGESAFDNCSNLANVYIPNSVKEIDSYAFYYCTSLLNVKIPGSVTRIGTSAFRGCSNLFRLEFSETQTLDIMSAAFYGCSALRIISCSAEVPPSCGSIVFGGIDKSLCTLSIPEASVNRYKSANGWQDFILIDGMYTDIKSPVAQQRQATEIARFTSDGQRIAAPRQGVNIVRMSDGSVRKVVVK